MKWIRLDNRSTHLGSGEIEFNQILLSLKMINHEIGNFTTSADYKFGYNIITDLDVDDLENSVEVIEKIAPVFSLIYHKGDISELESIVTVCDKVLGSSNYKILKRVSNDITPTICERDNSIIDLGAFFLKPTPHYFVEKYSLTEFISPDDIYALMMIKHKDLDNISDFKSFFDGNIICLCENSSTIIERTKFVKNEFNFEFHPYLDYGSVEWFKIFTGAKYFFEPNQILTCSSIESLYLNKSLFFKNSFELDIDHFAWTNYNGLWKLDILNSDIFDALDLRSKLIQVLRLI